MEIEKLINRINELYHKSQDVGLTPEELEEQKKDDIKERMAKVRAAKKNKKESEIQFGYKGENT